MVSPSRVLITGADGFTGRHMAEEMTQHGYEVYGTVLSGELGPREFKVDLLDHDRLRDVVEEVAPSIVIHLAGISFVHGSNFQTMYGVNIVGTRNLLSALSMAKLSIERVLLPSSAVVYGNVSQPLISESCKVIPTNDYGVSKVAMEMMAKNWFDDLPITITRPFNYTGLNQDSVFVIPKIVDHFKLRKEAIELGSRNVRREFNDVRDVCGIYRKLCDSERAVSQTVNVCSGRPICLDEVIDRLETSAGYKIERVLNSDFVRIGEIDTLAGDCTFMNYLVGSEDFIKFDDTVDWMLHDGVHRLTL